MTAQGWRSETTRMKRVWAGSRDYMSSVLKKKSVFLFEQNIAAQGKGCHGQNCDENTAIHEFISVPFSATCRLQRGAGCVGI
jgi:hypothetical protein